MKLDKCTILIPVFYNDKSRIPKYTIDNILRKLSDAFDGYTVTGHVDGCYQGQHEEMLSVVVAIHPDQYAELLEIVQYIGVITSQECIYVERIPECIELVDTRG